MANNGDKINNDPASAKPRPKDMDTKNSSSQIIINTDNANTSKPGFIIIAIGIATLTARNSIKG